MSPYFFSFIVIVVVVIVIININFRFRSKPNSSHAGAMAWPPGALVEQRCGADEKGGKKDGKR